jgi:ParB family chromosome partitioning protein
MHKKHELKLDPVMFALVKDGSKTFEYRKNDRNFEKGDSILLREFDRETQTYTGSWISFVANFILYGPDYGVPEGNCIISMCREHGLTMADNIEATTCLRSA